MTTNLKQRMTFRKFQSAIIKFFDLLETSNLADYNEEQRETTRELLRNLINKLNEIKNGLVCVEKVPMNSINKEFVNPKETTDSVLIEFPKVARRTSEKELRAVCGRVGHLLLEAGMIFDKQQRSRRKMMEDIFLQSYGLDGTLEPKLLAVAGGKYSISGDQAQKLIDQVWFGLKKRDCEYDPETLKVEISKIQQLSVQLALLPEEVFLRYFFCNV